MKKIVLLLIFITALTTAGFSQAVPSVTENSDYLVTFGKQANDTWGDDDHTQIYFFEIPAGIKTPVYIRVFDPEISGANDMVNGVYNSTSKFSIYGGAGAYSNKDARGANPSGNFKSGTLVATQTFTAADTKLNNTWYSFGPFNPQDGEFDKTLNANVFKIVVEGISGDDGNLYRLFLSTDKSTNTAVEGGNAFAYEITFRLKNTDGETGHVFPLVGDAVSSVKLNNFDADKDGYIRLTSVNKKCHDIKLSNDGNWESGKEDMTAEEKNTSLDIQFIKKKDFNNDMTFFISDQLGQALPLFAYPAGGIPKYKFKVDVSYDIEK